MHFSGGVAPCQAQQRDTPTHRVVSHTYDAPLDTKKEKRPVSSPSVLADDAVALSPPLPLRGKEEGAEGDLTPTPQQHSGPQTVCHAAYADTATELGGINQDNSVHALNSDPATIHSHVGGGGAEAEGVKKWEKGACLRV